MNIMSNDKNKFSLFNWLINLFKRRKLEKGTIYVSEAVFYVIDELIILEKQEKDYLLSSVEISFSSKDSSDISLIKEYLKKFDCFNFKFIPKENYITINLTRNTNDINKKIREIIYSISYEKVILLLSLCNLNKNNEAFSLNIQYIKDIISHIASLDNLPLMLPGTVVHLIAFHIEFNLNKNSQMLLWLQSKASISSEDILNFQLSLSTEEESSKYIREKWNTIESKWAQINNH